MKIFLLTRTDEESYEGQYVSAVVCALDAEDARLIHPADYEDWEVSDDHNNYYNWPLRRYVVATQIGEAVVGVKRGVIMAEYRPEAPKEGTRKLTRKGGPRIVEF